MKFSLLILFLFLTILEGLSQSKSEILIPYRIKDKWGLMNGNDSLVVPVKYQATYPLIHSRAKVKEGKKYGFVDRFGKMVIEPKFDAAYDFSLDHKARVEMKNRTFSIDSLGQDLHQISAFCSVPANFSCTNKIFKRNRLLGLYNFDLDTVLKAEYAEIIEDLNCQIIFVQKPTSKLGIVDYFGNQIMDFVLDSVEISNESNPRFHFVYQNGKVGAINAIGQIVADIKYTNLEAYEYCLKTILANGKLGYIYNRKEYWED